MVVSVGLLAGALFWALSGWFPGSWALAVTLVAAVRWLLFSYWMNSYWGGGLSALGGALIFGSVPRLARAARVRDGLTFGCGLVLLASTRPYEGLVFSVTLLVILIAWSRRGGTLRRLYRPALIGPLAAMLAVATAATLHFNARVTRDAFTLPYMEDRKEYAIAPLFVWGHMRPEPRYATQSLREVYVAEAERYQMTRTDLGIPELVRKFKNFWIFFLGPLLSVPFIAFWCARKKKDSPDEGIKLRYVRTIFVVMLAATAQAVWFYPHYFAPAFAPFVAVLLLGLRELRRWRWRGQPTGLFLKPGNSPRMSVDGEHPCLGTSARLASQLLAVAVGSWYSSRNPRTKNQVGAFGGREESSCVRRIRDEARSGI